MAESILRFSFIYVKISYFLARSSIQKRTELFLTPTAIILAIIMGRDTNEPVLETRNVITYLMRKIT